MENASKALLIAAGILLAILTLSLIVYARSRYSEFYTKQDELKEIEDISNFNLQFTNYQDRKVHGYEIISLANKVGDYNNKHSNISEARNDEKYNPITMIVDLAGQTDKFRLKNEEDDIISADTPLFTQDELTQSRVKNDIENIINTASGIEKFYRNADVAKKLAKTISSLVLTNNQLDHNVEIDQEYGISPEESRKNQKKKAVQRFNAIAKGNAIELNDSNIETAYDTMVNILLGGNKISDKSQSSVMKYYEYYQFKRGIFECTESDIEYDNVSGRVCKIKFTFTGEIE